MTRGFHRFRLLHQQPILLGLSGFLIVCLIVGFRADPGFGQATAPTPLPLSQTHPLPEFLEKWQDTAQQGDYFDAIEPTPVGYLIWSHFPVQVYIQPADAADLSGRSQAWYAAVQQAVQDWNLYLPLVVIGTEAEADITILRSAPPLQLAPQSADPEQQAPIDRLPRARSAETRYQILIHRPANQPATLIHRFMVYLTPNQTASYTLATARHEIGHALGIWGHSPAPADALYFSQVRNSPPISVRDINTLKRIYQQPTQLGWPIPE